LGARAARCRCTAARPTTPTVAPNPDEPQWRRVCYRGTAHDTAGNARDILIAHVIDPATAMVTQLWFVTNEKRAAVPPRWENKRRIELAMRSAHAFDVRDDDMLGDGSALGPQWSWNAWAYRIAIDDVDPAPRALVRATASLERFEQHTAIPSLGYAETVIATWVSCTELREDV
jgi:hypothetical protein